MCSGNTHGTKGCSASVGSGQVCRMPIKMFHLIKISRPWPSDLFVYSQVTAPDIYNCIRLIKKGRIVVSPYMIE